MHIFEAMIINIVLLVDGFWITNTLVNVYLILEFFYYIILFYFIILYFILFYSIIQVKKKNP